MNQLRRPLATAAAVALLVAGGLLLAATATARLDGLLGVGRSPVTPSALYVINADGTGRLRLTDEPGLIHWGPAWSPDGRALAYTRGTLSGPAGDLVLAGADGTGRRPLAADGRNNYLPAWSPDGARLAFAADRDGAEDIYVIDADGGTPRNLTRTPDLTEQIPTWSPDGTRLAFTALDPARGGLWPVPALRAAGLGLAAGLATAATLLLHGRRRGTSR